MDRFEYTLETAHPNAQALMSEDFYWSPIEATSPFGNDDGSNAAYGFREWRMTNQTASPIDYIGELLFARWNYPYFNWNEMDEERIKVYIETASEYGPQISARILEGIDSAIIGTGFAQFVLEGILHEHLSSLTITAIERQLLPVLIDRYDGDYREIRRSKLIKMMDVINRADYYEAAT